MTGFRLAAVLRARQAGEDVAKAAAAQARAEADAANAKTLAYQRQLEGQRAPDASSAAAFFATMRARQALAGALSDALTVAASTERELAARLDDLIVARTKRKALEHLAERHAEARRRAEDAAEQDAADDLAGAAHHRSRRPR